MPGQTDNRGGPINVPQGTGGWHFESYPPTANTEHLSTVRYQMSARGTTRLTAAGVHALVAALVGYHTTNKLTAIIQRSGVTGAANPGFEVTRDSAWITILPEDALTVEALVATVFQSTTNVA